MDDETTTRACEITERTLLASLAQSVRSGKVTRSRLNISANYRVHGIVGPLLTTRPNVVVKWRDTCADLGSLLLDALNFIDFTFDFEL